jgi:cytochrome c2
MSDTDTYQGITTIISRFIAVSVLIVLLAGCVSLPWEPEPPQGLAGGNPLRGTVAIQNYGCGACHNIPGIPNADALVGPPLNAWAERRYISGKLPNEPQHLIRWIRFPQEIEPGTAMPNLGVSEQEARDISAYLYTLGDESVTYESSARKSVNVRR